jgi:hypothetical protein
VGTLRYTARTVLSYAHLSSARLQRKAPAHAYTCYWCRSTRRHLHLARSNGSAPGGAADWKARCIAILAIALYIAVGVVAVVAMTCRVQWPPHQNLGLAVATHNNAPSQCAEMAWRLSRNQLGRRTGLRRPKKSAAGAQWSSMLHRYSMRSMVRWVRAYGYSILGRLAQSSGPPRFGRTINDGA